MLISYEHIMNRVFIDQFNLLINQIKAEFLNAQIENDIKEMRMHEFRLRNVKKVLNTIKKLDFEITDVADVKGISGVGAGTIRRIKEILDTGHLSELKAKYAAPKQKKIDSIQNLTKVIGIGPKTAKKLVIENKIHSVDDLIKAHKKGQIKLSGTILMGLKYYGIVQTDIPRSEIAAVETYVKKIAEAVDPDINIMICGSYRRGKKTSGDIDILMTHPEIKKIKHIGSPSYLDLLVEELKTEGFILDDLTDTNAKYMGFCAYKKNPVRRIDIRFVPFDSLYPAMVYFTGPLELNMIMREKAKKRKMLLNEYGLYKISMRNGDEEFASIKISSEAKLFEKLGMKYLTPTQREDYAIGKKNF